MIKDDIEKVSRFMDNCPGFEGSKIKTWRAWCCHCGYHKDVHQPKDYRGNLIDLLPVVFKLGLSLHVGCYDDSNGVTEVTLLGTPDIEVNDILTKPNRLARTVFNLVIRVLNEKEK